MPASINAETLPKGDQKRSGIAQGAIFAMTIKQVTKRSHGFKSRGNDTHPSSAFELVKGQRAIGEERTSPDYNLGKPNGGHALDASMKANKKRHVDLAKRAHAHTQVSPGPTDGVVQPVNVVRANPQGEGPHRHHAARIESRKRALQR
jgi:hypothetical protein